MLYALANVVSVLNVALPMTVIVPVCVTLPRLSVKLLPPSVIDATLIAAEPLRSVALAVIVVAPRSIWSFVVCTMPAIFVPDGPVVVSRPPSNVTVSPASLPSVTVPVLRKFVSVSIIVVVPPKTTLYALAKVVSVLKVAIPLTVTVPV